MAWKCLLELDAQMRKTDGGENALREAIGRGADLRILSGFFHDEHVDTNSTDHELVEESMDMRVTYLIDNRWCAGIQSLRQPVELPDRFGLRPSLSLFMYNENGLQAIARPYLDGPPQLGVPDAHPPDLYPDMPKYIEFDSFDKGTNAPSSNFIYYFERLRYFVCDDWKQGLHHSSSGEVISGSADELLDALRRGCEFKVGVKDLCSDLCRPGQTPLEHWVFVNAGACYFYTKKKWMVTGTLPLPRVRPAIPLTYESKAWDYGWLISRSDGHVAELIYDPYTLQPRRETRQLELRWFYR